MKDYLALWDDGPPDRKVPITVTGECIRGTKSQFARVRVTIQAANSFEVEDCVGEKEALEELNVRWPEPFTLGLLETLGNAETPPSKNVKITLEKVWYHDADLSREAFFNAGCDVGSKVIAEFDNRHS